MRPYEVPYEIPYDLWHARSSCCPQPWELDGGHYLQSKEPSPWNTLNNRIVSALLVVGRLALGMRNWNWATQHVKSRGMHPLMQNQHSHWSKTKPKQRRINFESHKTAILENHNASQAKRCWVYHKILKRLGPRILGRSHLVDPCASGLLEPQLT